MPFSPRRAILTLATAGTIILGGPALGYAQQQQPSADYARYGPAPGARDDAGFTAAAPYESFDLRQDDNDNGRASANDNAYDNGDDTADDGNVNDNVVASRDEADFLRDALSDSAAEIRAGELAQMQAGTEEVRQLGARMTGEHQAMLTAAQDVASRYGIGVPSEPTSWEDQQRVADLASRTGDDFDRLYLASLVWDQRNDIVDFQAARSALRDDVAELASQHLGTLENELVVAREAADRLGYDVD